jgi:hypothetical protein
MAFVGILSTMLLDEMFVRGTGAADLEGAATPLRRMVATPAA